MKDFEQFSSSLYLHGLKRESDSAAESLNQKTFIIFGVPRGGTTMVARVAERLGVEMGKNLPSNYEDDEFNFDKMSDTLKEDSTVMARALMRAIKRRDARYDVWGWKYPRAHLYLPLIIKQVRNPQLICVFRDPVASSLRPLSRRRVQREGKAQLPTRVMKQHLGWQMNNIELIHKLNLPTFLCSYEQAVLGPTAFVEDLSKFIGLRRDERSVVDAVEQIRPGGYIQA